MTYNISLIQGEDFCLTATLKESNGNPIDLSGYYTRGKVKYSYGSTGSLIDLNPFIDSPESGIIRIELSAAQTASLPITMAVYDIEKYAENDANVSKVLRGTFSVSPEATK